ncbi:MAG: MFS transporter [Verrucomicrobia bacterium]|nr:MFS transporter [Verrucomicrobiota bacterium]
MSNSNQNVASPNAMRLLWAGFMAILAAGVGFAIRGGIIDNWGSEYGFNATQLGAINGAGFSGFCFGIIVGGVICDKLGYGKLVILAFALHVLSAVVTFTASGPGAYNALYWGMFLFAYANGTLEAVANPLVATLFPNKRTHYLNILHASWPAGLVIGSALGWVLDDKMKLSWQLQLSLYLIPTLIYGIMFLGQHMPKSEASEKGLSMGEMFKDVGLIGTLIVCYLLTLFCQNALKLPAGVAYGLSGAMLIVVAIITRFSFGSMLLFVLFITHALVGAVELGTDGWIQNITGNLFTSEQGKYLFMWTSAIMFSLRFCADFIEKRLGLSPIGLLLVCAVLACVGLNLASRMTSFGVALLALSIYAVGKTFFWPTMLAVASDRFPRTGAVAISIMGGIGMLSAGMIGSPGLGYAKDRFTGEDLKKADAAVFNTYKAETPSKFLTFDEIYGLDGKKFGEITTKLAKEREAIEKSGGDVSKASERLSPDEKKVHDASISGDRRTLVADSVIPAIMAAIYLGIMLYFKAIGGYKAVHIDAANSQAKQA